MAQSTVEYLKRDVVDLTKEAPIRVLHVDNEAGFLKAAKTCLEMQGALEVETALSVEEAMEKMKKKTYDAIVSDYVMPGKNGLEFLKELRDNGNKIPFIIFTGKGREEVAIKALNHGADQYLNKTGYPETVYGELAHGIRRAVERKRAENILRESEEKYRNLFENARDVTLTLDLKGNITSISKAAVEYGFKKDEIIGKNMLEFTSKKNWPKLLKELVQLARGKKVEGNIEIDTSKGKKIAEYWSNPIIIDNKVVGVQTILKDNTERKNTEEKLTKSEERYKTLIEEAPICICNTDLKGKITYVNRRFEEVTGYSRKEIVGKGGLKFVSDETLKLLTKRMKERLMGKPSRLQQGKFKHKDGKWIWAEIEGKIIKKFGIPVGFQLIARDITERKRVQKELTETLEKLEAMNEKLSVVGKLTRHDTRNKLSAVTMNVFLTKQKLAGDYEALEHLSEIESACGQVEKIFDFAGIYEKLGAEKLAYMNVEKTVEDAAMLFSDLQGVEVLNDCHELTVLADSLLRQLFHNLIDNSLKHGENVSQIRVYYEEAGKDKLKLVYEDDGVGIPKAEKEKIFKEGYGKGTGYGLYLIRKMCEVYGWVIRETGKQGKGAQFTTTIPKMDKNGKESYRFLKNFDSKRTVYTHVEKMKV